MMVGSNNKALARNTILLYIRMFVMMLMSLYTSRLVLNILGVSDYGIYNVVGGVVVVFSFLNSTMSASCQRFITYELGKGDYARLKSVFNTSFQIHILLVFLVLLLSETIGLWFVNTQMHFPSNREMAVNCIYQLSILACIVQIVKIPFAAEIIAHEKMDIYAYTSILGVVLKLLLVLLLTFLTYDKLVLYALIMLFIGVVILLIHIIYCKRNFEEIVFKKTINKQEFREIGKFAGWNIFSDIASVLNEQGINIMLNIYFGPVVNAARGIGTQVLGAIHEFIYNFQTAAVPQITKAYASEDLNRLHKLIIVTSKVSFFLLLLIVIPLLFETEPILKFWLKILPDYTVVFVRIILITKLAEVMSGALEHSIKATGDIKKFQIIISSISFLTILLSFVLLYLGYPPYCVYISSLIFAIIAQICRICVVLPKVGMAYMTYIKEVLLRSFSVLFLSIMISSFIVFYILDSGIIRFLVVGIVNAIFVLLFAYLIGVNSYERLVIKNMILEKFRHEKK